MKAKILTR